MQTTIRPSQITFGPDGESHEVLTNGDARVFLRTPDGVQYEVATVEGGEPTEGNQYLRSVDLTELLGTLAQRGYRIEAQA